MMEKHRSQSCRDGRMVQMEGYNGGVPSSMKDLRSYSTSNPNMKKGASASKNWRLGDPELQRKKRVAGYKVYSVEGKMKGSFRKSFRWIKHTYTQVVYGFR